MNICRFFCRCSAIDIVPMLSGSLRLCADSSPARAPAVLSHGSPGRSSFRYADITTTSHNCRRQLELSTQALPSEFDGFSRGSTDRRLVSSASSSAAETGRAGLDSRSPRGDVPGVMCSPFRQLLTSSSPDIHTLHSILIKLHRSEATTADLNHSGQSISLLFSLASDTASANADSADMATAILASLATSPAARGQLPPHVRQHLTDALVSLVDSDTRGMGASKSPASPVEEAVRPAARSHSPQFEPPQRSTMPVHGILHEDLPPASSMAPSFIPRQGQGEHASRAALAQATAARFASARDDPVSDAPRPPVVTELHDDLFVTRSQWPQQGRSRSREGPQSGSGIPCPDPADPPGDSPVPAVMRNMSTRTSAFLQASNKPPASAAASAISLATSAARAAGKRPPGAATAATAAARTMAGVAATAATVGEAATATAHPVAAPARVAHSLRDSESDAAVVTAVTLFLSKCGLVRSSLARATPLAGVLTAGGPLADGGGKRTVEEEEGARLAGRRSAAALAVGAAAAADETMLRQLHEHNVPEVCSSTVSPELSSAPMPFSSLQGPCQCHLHRIPCQDSPGPRARRQHASRPSSRHMRVHDRLLAVSQPALLACRRPFHRPEQVCVPSTCGPGSWPEW